MPPQQAFKINIIWGDFMGNISKVDACSNEDFVQLCETSNSISEINYKLGYKKPGTHTYALIKKRVKSLNRPDLEDKIFGKCFRSQNTKLIEEISCEDLRKIVQESSSYAECLDKLGAIRNGTDKKSYNGRTYDVIKEKILKNNIDISHFSQMSGIKNYNDSCKINIEDYFSEKNWHGTTAMRRIILRENLIPYKCHICGNDGEWLGQPLTLQLHHIDGNRENNSLSNLMFLCPNCHSQTDNYGGKNVK